MTTNKQNFFELVTEKIKTNTLPETDLLNTTVLFFDLLKKASTDRQWLAKRLPHNTQLLDLFVLFTKEELIKKLPNIATLNELDFSLSIPSLITTHHKILRDACEQFLQQQLEPLLSFTFNIEKGEFLLLKKLLFYIDHAFNL